jgi:hypothetical protein
MPTFYFNVSNHRSLEDTEGTDLPTLEAARQHAFTVAREIMQHRKEMLGKPWSDWTMRVTDSKGQEVFSFRIAAAAGGYQD